MCNGGPRVGVWEKTQEELLGAPNLRSERV